MKIRKSLSLIVLTLFSLSLLADAAPKPTPTPTPRGSRRAAAAVSPTPDATPKPRRGWFGWLFKKRVRRAEAVSTPTPTPKKSRRKTAPETEKPTPTPAPQKQEQKAPEPKAPPAPEKKVTEQKAPEQKEKSVEKKSAEKLEAEVPFVPEQNGNAEPKKIGGGTPAPAGDDAAERAKYQQARSKALEDKKVRELQAQSDAAASEAEQKTLTRSYYKALYSRMRKIDPSIRERIDRTEAASLKRLERESAPAANGAQE